MQHNTLPTEKTCTPDKDKKLFFTLWLEQSRNSQLFLSKVKCLLQVFLMAAGLDLGEIHQIWAKRTQDGQEQLTTPPAGLEVLYTGCATNPGEKMMMRRSILSEEK